MRLEEVVAGFACRLWSAHITSGTLRSVVRLLDLRRRFS